MKKLLPYLLIGYISIIGGFNCASAQKVQASYKFKDLNFEIPGQASQPVEATAAPRSGSEEISPLNINKKALRDFRESFKDATDEHWYETKERDLVVKFSNNNVQTRVFYHRKGQRFATILDYSEENLPESVRRLVRSTYYDYSIFHIADVRLNGQQAYVISLEAKTSWKHIRVIDGEIIEDANFEKR